MGADGCTLMVFTRTPVPGRVNKRLIPALGEAAATELYLELLRKTLATATSAGIGEVQLHCTPTVDHAGLRDLAGEFGVSLHRQAGQDLGERMANALHDALAAGGCAVLVGGDIPELAESDLATARDRLESDCDVVLGPAEDGGYYLIGLVRECPGLFSDLEWGRGGVLGQTRQRIRRRGLHCFELPQRWDVDRPEDVWRYRERFATRINLADKC